MIKIIKGIIVINCYNKNNNISNFIMLLMKDIQKLSYDLNMYNYYQIKSFGGQIFLEILQGLILKMIRIYISIKFVVGVMFYTLFLFKRKKVKCKIIINLFYFYFFTTCVNERAASNFSRNGKQMKVNFF